MLFAWPFIDKRMHRDLAAHHLLERPRERPMRTALGAAALSFYVVLFFAGSNDLISKWFSVPVDTIVWMFRIASIATPIVVGLVTHRLMSALQRSGAEQFTKVPLQYFLHGKLVHARGIEP
jgi:ubiquinol-cytochrome c reductase cytochrome b subunit